MIPEMIDGQVDCQTNVAPTLRVISTLPYNEVLLTIL